MRRILVGVRWFLVTVGIVVLTSFSIDATDALRGSQSALSIFARNVAEGPCPSGMVAMDLAAGTLCVDVYENSVGEACPVLNPASPVDTKTNLDTSGCVAVSKPEAAPWTFVANHQAAALCAARGARLPTPEEWYEAALGTPDTGVCNTSRGSGQTGVPGCVSARGAYDMVGNVWEWVDGEVVTGAFGGRTVPPEGYVRAVDGAGIPVETSSQADPLFNGDYFWSAPEGTYAMMRGGFYSSGEDGGVYATHAKSAPAFASQATGFRCVATPS